MHPEIQLSYPGFCPICGMALEAVLAGKEIRENPEFIDMKKRFLVAVILTLPLWLIMIFGHQFLEQLPGNRLNWLQAIFATPVVLWCGKPFFVRGFKSLQTRQFESHPRAQYTLLRNICKIQHLSLKKQLKVTADFLLNSPRVIWFYLSSGN